jgi:hypothetical protein
MELCSVNEVTKSVWLVWLPHLLVACWLLYLGASIWQHALHSMQPPLYDALSYMQKAMNFWQAVEQGKLFNPMNIEPTVRPFGTILMSYPFGFSPDFHGFHFRSVFLPILSIVAAVYIVSGTTPIKATGWWVAAIAFLFSSLPMFYHFDWNEDLLSPVRWGLVDNFQAGIAAMASAALARSLLSRSISYLLLGALLASCTLLIKPSGLMVMALVALIWLMAVALERLWASRLHSQVSSLRTYVFKGTACILGVYICVSVLCVLSDYLSGGSFAFAKQVLVVMHEAIEQITFQKTLSLFHRSSGEAFVLWVIGVGVLFICHLPANRKGHAILSARVSELLVGSLFIWILGAWYWLVVQAGGNQIRYFFPFMLMGGICVIPAALQAWPRSNRPIRVLSMAICFLPALNIACLLAAGDTPPIPWQKMTGVSISVGRDREEIHQAYAFLDGLRGTNKNVQIFSFFDGIQSAIFENVGTYERLMRPKMAGFQVVLPMDWIRGLVVRIDDLLNSDYVLIKKYTKQNVEKLLAIKRIDSFGFESGTFESWLSTLNEQSGVEIASDGRILRLLRIADRAALNRAIDTFISMREWRPEFKATNQPMWWNKDTVKAGAGKPAAEDIGFGDVYKLRALAINRVKQGIKIEVWWEELHHEEANNQRYLFFHLVDKSGQIIHNQQIALFPYNPPDKGKRWRHGETIFNGVLSDDNLTSLAFGIYGPSGQLLMDDKRMQSDWGGRRVLVPLSAFPGTVGK